MPSQLTMAGRRKAEHRISFLHIVSPRRRVQLSAVFVVVPAYPEPARKSPDMLARRNAPQNLCVSTPC